MNDDAIRDLFRTHGVALSREDVWKVQGTPVVKHSALERLSAAIGITWDMPKEVIASMDEVVILARGVRKDGIAEWSYGEVKVVRGENGGNYRISGKQAGYPFAMAEKRAKDRVIIKLAGLHGAYSEEEADDFNQRNADGGTSTGARGRNKPSANDDRPTIRPEDEAGAPDEVGRAQSDERVVEEKPVDPKPETKPETKPEPSDEDEAADVVALRNAISKARTTKAVTDLMLKGDTQAILNRVDPELRDTLRDVAKARLVALGWPGKGSEDSKAA
jgi:hypothetical protein